MLQFSLWHSLPFSSTTSVAIHFALLPNCSHSKVWSSPKVIHWARKIVPVLSTSASVSAVCQKYSPLWLHLMPDGLYWDMVRVFVHSPQDFSRQDANPSLLSGSVTPPSAEARKMAQPWYPACHKQLLYRVGGGNRNCCRVSWTTFKLFAGWKWWASTGKSFWEYSGTWIHLDQRVAWVMWQSCGYSLQFITHNRICVLIANDFQLSLLLNTYEIILWLLLVFPEVVQSNRADTLGRAKYTTLFATCY